MHSLAAMTVQICVIYRSIGIVSHPGSVRNVNGASLGFLGWWGVASEMLDGGVICSPQRVIEIVTAMTVFIREITRDENLFGKRY